jgi:NAD(P)H-hydrate epimerase
MSARLLVLTAAEMRAVDARAAREHGLAVELLMERAGAGAVAAMEAHFGDLRGYRVAVACGRGHNGGDGLVVARRLAERGAAVEVGVLAPLAELAGAVAANARALVAAGVTPVERTAPRAIADWLAGKRWDYAVDALLGTGSRGPVQGAFAEAVAALNQARSRGARVVALDLPTGLDADTGAPGEPCVTADLTVTFAYLKRGHVLYPGRRHAGAVEVVDIGIPPAAAEAEGCRVELLTPRLAAELAPRRPDTAHKGTSGHGLLVGGSVGFTGAVSLAAEAALAAGLGLVYAAVPASVNDALEARLTEPITFPVAETAGRAIAKAALPALLERAARVSALAVGPGLGQDAEAPELVLGLLERVRLPAVVDADGLNALARVPEWWKRVAGPLVLTPHLGEMARLTGSTPAALEAARIDAALEWAASWGAIVLLKGAPTVVAAPDGRATVNPSGNPGMASAGMGDVLTGCILAFLAQGLSPYDAARLGAFVHGRAADRLVARRGVALVLAGEVGREIPGTLAELARLAGVSPLPPSLPARPVLPPPETRAP